MSSRDAQGTVITGRQELMHRIGKEGEENVVERLSKLFGYRNVSFGVDGYSTGTDGFPDVKLIYNDYLFYIEVKSIIPFVKRYGKKIRNRQNTVKLNRDAWSRLKKRAKGKLSTILMIIELRLVGDNDYFIIDYDTLEDLVISSTSSEWVHIPLWFILLNCRKLAFIESEFIPNVIDSNQSRI